MIQLLNKRTSLYFVIISKSVRIFNVKLEFYYLMFKYIIFNNISEFQKYSISIGQLLLKWKFTLDFFNSEPEIRTCLKEFFPL